MLVRFVEDELKEYKKKRRLGMYSDLDAKCKLLAVLATGVPYSYEILLDMINVDDVIPDITMDELKLIVEALIEEGLLYEIEPLYGIGGDMRANPN